MIIDITEISERDFALSGIYATRNYMKSRITVDIQQKRSNIIYILSGKIKMDMGGGRYEVFGADSAVYFPGEYHRKMTIEEIPTRYMRLDLLLKIDGEIALFSNEPTELGGFSPAAVRAAINELHAACKIKKNKLARCEKMCRLLSALGERKANAPSRKIEPAIAYINENFTKKIDMRALAKDCFLSTAQFYNLFNAHFGITPLEYKSKLLIDSACELLSSGELTTAEVAERLGFSDAAYFSRFFKKSTGYSPTEFIKRRENF